MLAIAAHSFGSPSETFIHNHVREISPSKTVLICQDDAGAIDFKCPILSDIRRLSPAPHLPGRIFNSLQSRWWDRIDPAAYGANEARIRNFLHRHGVEKVLAEYGPMGSLLRVACKRAKIPLFVHFHGFDATMLPREFRWRRLYKKLFRDVAGVIVPSQFLHQRLIDIGAPRKKIHLSPNGIDTELFSPGLPEKGRIIAVSRLVPVKGPLFTLRAFYKVKKNIPYSTLDFVGDGILRDECIDEVNKLGLSDSVKFHGSLPNYKVANLMKKASIFVQHSVKTEDGQTEAFGITPLEASSTGLPIVATRSGGLIETVKDGVSGILIDEKNTEDMANSILFLINNNEAALKMGMSGRQIVLDKYSISSSADRILSIIDANGTL